MRPRCTFVNSCRLLPYDDGQSHESNGRDFLHFFERPVTNQIGQYISLACLALDAVSAKVAVVMQLPITAPPNPHSESPHTYGQVCTRLRMARRAWHASIAAQSLQALCRGAGVAYSMSVTEPPVHGETRLKCLMAPMAILCLFW